MDPIVELLQALAPADMTVIVLCERGLTSPKLWRQIRAQSLPRTGYGGWYPYVRYPKNITFCAPDPSFPNLIPRGSVVEPLSKGRGQTPLHPAGGLVRRPAGTLDHTDRPSSGSGEGELVRTVLLDRTGFQSLPRTGYGGHQEPGLAMAQDPADGPGAYLPPLAGAAGSLTNRGDPAGPGLWRQSGVCPGPQGKIDPGRLRTPPRTPAPGRHDPGHRPARTVSVIRYGIGWPGSLTNHGCSTRADSGVGFGCCLNPGRNPSPISRSSAMPLPKQPFTPLSGIKYGAGSGLGSGATVWDCSGPGRTAR